MLEDLLNYWEHIQVHGREIAIFISFYIFKSVLFVKAYCLVLGVHRDVSASNFLGEAMYFAYSSKELYLPILVPESFSSTAILAIFIAGYF